MGFGFRALGVEFRVYRAFGLGVEGLGVRGCLRAGGLETRISGLRFGPKLTTLKP